MIFKGVGLDWKKMDLDWKKMDCMSRLATTLTKLKINEKGVKYMYRDLYYYWRCREKR